MGRDVMKGTLRRKIKNEFCIACSRGHSAGHFVTKNRCVAQFLTELLRNLLFKTCIMKNSKLISKFDIHLHNYKSGDFPWFP